MKLWSATALLILAGPGAAEEAPEFKNFSWNLGGLRTRNGGLPGSHPRSRFEFKNPQPSFALELLVDGPEVHAHIEGRRVGTYHTIDGHPVEGYRGFAAS